MDYVCSCAILQGLTPRKRAQLKHQIPQLRTYRVPEHLWNVEISHECPLNISDGCTGLTIEWTERYRKSQNEPWRYFGITKWLCSMNILEMFLFNKMNRKGNVIDQLRIRDCEKALEVLYTMTLVATIKELAIDQKQKGPCPKFSKFTSIASIKNLFYSSSDKFQPSLAVEINSVNFERVRLRIKGYDESMLSLKPPMLMITDEKCDVDFFWRFAKKLQKGNFEADSYYTAYVRGYTNDEFSRRVSSEFPDAQPVPEESQEMTVPISDTKALEVQFAHEFSLRATVYMISDIATEGRSRGLCVDLKYRS